MKITRETIDLLIDKYNEFYHTDIRENCRNRDLVMARHCFFYVLRREYDMPYTSIADIFSKNHASIIHGERVVSDMLSIGDRITENKLKDIIDLFRLYSIEITNYVCAKAEMINNLENMLKSLRIIEEVSREDIIRLVDSVWKSKPSEVA